MNIHLVHSDTDIEKCFPVMVQLRTKLSKEEFITRVNRQQQFGYKLAYLEENGEIISLAGFRIFEALATGKSLYVDELVTDEKHRSKGYGETIFDWLVDFAKKEQCKVLQLDSGVQRFDAHRFYMKKRMSIYSYRFLLPLE